MSNIASNTISVLGGAALGAAAAYLLDPDHGDDRRQQIISSANDAVSNAGDAVRSTVHDTTGSAKGLAASLGHYAQQLANQVSSHAGTVKDQAQSAGTQARSAADQSRDELNSSIQSLISQARDYAADLKSKAQSRSNDLSDRAKSSLSRQTGWEPSGTSTAAAAGITGGVLGALVLGAGVMFFADPAKGRSRRAWASDKINSWVIRGNKSATRYGRHVGNQLKGVAAQARNAVPEQWSGTVDKVVEHAKDVAKSATDAVQQNPE
jgi:gas vesicle protein